MISNEAEDKLVNGCANGCVGCIYIVIAAGAVVTTIAVGAICWAVRHYLVLAQ